MILDELIWGIDVGVYVEIICLIEKLCNEGLVLLIIFFELEELVGYVDCVIVLWDCCYIV